MALFNPMGLGDDFFDPGFPSFRDPFGGFPSQQQQQTGFREDFGGGRGVRPGGVSPTGRVNGFETVSDNEDAYEIQVNENG